MKSLIRGALGAFILLFPVLSKAIVNQAKTLVNEDSGQTLFLLSDTHLDKEGGKATKAQQQAIINGAKKHNALVIAEDGYSYPVQAFKPLGFSESKITTLDNFLTRARADFEKYDGMSSETNHLLKFANTTIDLPLNPQRFVNNPWHKACGYTPLSTLVEQCKALGLEACTFDFMLAHRASEWGYPISLDDVMNAEQKLIDSILTTTKESTFKPYYQEFIDNYYAHPGVTMLKSLAHSDASLNFKDLKKADVTIPILHEKDLMNAHLLQLVEQHIDNPRTIIIYAGHEHISAILPALIDAGYTQKSTTGTGAWFGNTNHCILPVVNLENVF